MKVVVAGGTGLIGSRVVANLRDQGHDAVAASLSAGINTITGEGLLAAMAGATAVVDVTDSRASEDTAAFEFFETSTETILDVDMAVGVQHHVVLSIVGIDRTTGSGYYGAKLRQEELVRQSGIPFTIVRATQFFEFVDGIAAEASDGDVVRVPTVLVQPMAADDTAAALCEVVLEPGRNALVEVGGPQPLRLDDFVRRGLRSRGDQRQVVADPEARYFGASLKERSLLPGNNAHLGTIRYEAWLAARSR
jgi:uncharacterized protein YbjT (DUF2867 family)